MCFLVTREDNDRRDYLGIFLRLFLCYIPFCLVLLFDVFTVLRIYIYFYKNKMNFHEKDIRNLALYPLVLFLSWIGVIIKVIMEVFNYSGYSLIDVLDIPFATLNGFLNAIVYGYISINPFKLFQKKEHQPDYTHVFIN